MRRLHSITRQAAAAVVLVGALAGCRFADARQRINGGDVAERAERDVHVQHGADMAMAGHDHAAMAAHLLYSPARPPTAADSARAAGIVRVLRDAIAPYRDVRRAEADGYRQFAPQVKDQRVYHFTRRARALKEMFRFDPAQPTSLLYTRDSAGAFRLQGAMYVAPKRATPEDLDARIPLSVARWHRHVKICVPPRGATERWTETVDGMPKFGPSGAIATEAACDAAGGRWLESLFGWMVHVNAFEEPAFER